VQSAAKFLQRLRRAQVTKEAELLRNLDRTRRMLETWLICQA
jgi:hypothetical protein